MQLLTTRNLKITHNATRAQPPGLKLGGLPRVERVETPSNAYLAFHYCSLKQAA